VNIFDSLKHYYAEKIALACQSELNINKLKFLVLYEWTRMFEFVMKNAINAWKEFKMYSINSKNILSKLSLKWLKTSEQSQNIFFNKTSRSVQDLWIFLNYVIEHEQLIFTSQTQILKTTKNSENAMIRSLFLKEENKTLQKILHSQRQEWECEQDIKKERVLCSHKMTQTSQNMKKNAKKTVTKIFRQIFKTLREFNSSMKLTLRFYCNEFQI